MDKYYLTEKRLEELKEKLEDLKINKRREIAERLKQAKEFGDLSENSEYASAKEDKSKLERDIFDLEDILKRASIIQKSGVVDVVEVGSTVRVKKNDDVFSYQIVGPSEANPQGGKISNESPLGKGLLGCRVGDVVKIDAPGGVAEYHITKIE